MGCVSVVQAQDSLTVRYDSSAVAVRAVPADVLDAFRNNPDFVYDEASGTTESWWSQLGNWLLQKVLIPIFGRVPLWVYKWLFYLLIAAVLFFAITKLLQVSPRSLFMGTRKEKGLAFEDMEGDLQAINFAERIAEAEVDHDYRRAVRLRYLKVLQQLEEQGGIVWKPDKTNHEYLAELTPTSLRPAFARVTYLFEYIWYGDLPVDDARYDRAKAAFRTFEESQAGAVVAHP